MRFAQKKRAMTKAYRLGANTGMEQKMIKEGKIRRLEDGTYEVFSQEARSGEGEKASAGDFFKVDGSGYPYPMSAESFLANHEHVEGDTYAQIPKPRAIWEYGDPVFPEMQYLLDSGQLVLKEDDEREYFHACLYGAQLSSPRDSVLVFYSMEKDDQGKMSFNFVARKEFDRTYDYVIE